MRFTLFIAGLLSLVLLVAASAKAQPDSGCEGSKSFRNAGTNPISDSGNAPRLGKIFVGWVSVGATTHHDFAFLVGFADPLTFILPGGQALLVDLNSLEIFFSGPQPGPLAVFNVVVPNDTNLCGVSLSTQALHIGGVTPFALSNAMDYVIGI